MGPLFELVSTRGIRATLVTNWWALAPVIILIISSLRSPGRGCLRDGLRSIPRWNGSKSVFNQVLTIEGKPAPVFTRYFRRTQNVIDYFAYGSNLNLHHLQDWLHRFGVGPEGVSDPRRAVLHNFCIRTNYYSTTHAAGACNIESAEGAVVEGLVMTITLPTLEAIKIKEGWPGAYIDQEVAVHIDGEEDPISVITFVVHPDRRLEHDEPVTRKYRDFVLAGAEEAVLSPEYQEHLRRILRTAPESPISSPDETTGEECLLGRSPGNRTPLG